MIYKTSGLRKQGQWVDEDTGCSSFCWCHCAAALLFESGTKGSLPNKPVVWGITTWCMSPHYSTFEFVIRYLPMKILFILFESHSCLRIFYFRLLSGTWIFCFIFFAICAGSLVYLDCHSFCRTAPHSALHCDWKARGNLRKPCSFWERDYYMVWGPLKLSFIFQHLYLYLWKPRLRYDAISPL